MDFVKVAQVSEVLPGTMKLVQVGGKDVLLVNAGGSFYAVSNRCTHLGGSLVKGRLEGTTVTCPRHGAQFDVKTGQAVGEAKIALLKMKVKNVEKFAVKVEGIDILVGAG